MTPTRTPTVDVDVEFDVTIPITKAVVDKDGTRRIVGVASGVLEDRDGERMSVNAIKDMVRQVKKGGVKITSRHQQDWDTEIGDARDASHDPETDELILEAVLPREGEDPMADKAWKVAQTQRVGFSVGGKLTKSYFERNDLGKRRKVLDGIGLRHFALTKNPSYAPSFAEAIAKSYDPSEPADDEFTLELTAEDVSKDTTGSWAGGSSDSGGGNVGRDSAGSGPRNAGERKPDAKRPNTEDDGTDDEDQDAKDLPKAADERRLACPNCGHEFAADLPVNPDDQQPDGDTDHDNDDGQDDETGKTAKEPTTAMSRLTDTVESLRALAAGEVAKTDTPAPGDVAKAATEGVEIEKIVAASHMQLHDELEALTGKLQPAFEAIAKTIKGIREEIKDLPQGRRSVAVVHARDGRVIKDGQLDGGQVEKSVEEMIAETDDPLEALKIANAASGWGAGR